MKRKQKKYLALSLVLCMVATTACIPHYSTQEQRDDYGYKYCTEAEKWFKDNLPDASSITYTYYTGDVYAYLNDTITDVVFGEFYLNGQRFDYYLNADKDLLYIGGENIYNEAYANVKETIAEGLGIASGDISFKNMVFANVTSSLMFDSYKAGKSDKKTGKYTIENMGSGASCVTLNGYILYGTSDEDVLKLIEEEFNNPSERKGDYESAIKSEGELILANGALPKDLSNLDILKEVVDKYPIFRRVEVEDFASFEIIKDGNSDKEYEVLSVYAESETDGFPMELMDMESIDNVIFYPEYYLNPDKNLDEQISYHWNLATPNYYTVCNDGPDYDIRIEEIDGDVSLTRHEIDGMKYFNFEAEASDKEEIKTLDRISFEIPCDDTQAEYGRILRYDEVMDQVVYMYDGEVYCLRTMKTPEFEDISESSCEWIRQSEYNRYDAKPTKPTDYNYDSTPGHNLMVYIGAKGKGMLAWYQAGRSWAIIMPQGATEEKLVKMYKLITINAVN